MSVIQSLLQKIGKARLYLLGLIIIVAVAGFFYSKQSQNTDVKSNLVASSELQEKNVEKLNPENLVLSSASYPAASVVNITNFEQNEDVKWQGGGILDDKVSFEGDRSLSLASINHNEVISYMKKDLDLSNTEYLELMVNVSDVSARESTVLELGDLEMKNYYQYTLTNLENRWSVLQIPKKLFVPYIDPKSDFSWQKIQRVQLRVTSRMGGMVIVRFDVFNAINNSYDLIKDWRVYNDNQKLFLSYFNKNNEIKQLAARSVGAITGILENKRNIRDFIMSASVSPQSSARSGLFVRGNYNNNFGYYFLIGGDRSNTWEINKLNKNGWLLNSEKIQGNIGNEVLQKGKDYLLRVESRSDTMEFFLSFDGVKYYKLGEIKDAEFKSGGLGISVLDGGGWSVFDNIMVKEL